MEPPADDHPVTCPRCGYELRGVVVTWTVSCPLDGTCSECGLAFEWGELLSPSRSIPPWCVEARPPRVVTPRQAIGTLGRTLWPWWLWRRVRLVHPRRWGRIVAYLVLLVLANYVLFAAANGVMAAREYADTSRMPGATLNDEPWRVGLHAVTVPFSNGSFGTYTVSSTFPAGPGARVFPATPPRYFAVYVRGESFARAAFLALTVLASGLAFAALPISRRRAKVRWAHIVRVTVYAMAIPLVVLAADSIIAMLQPPGSRFFGGGGDPALIMTTYAAAALWALAWWHAAVGRYLRMEHAAAVSCAVVVLGFLGPLSAWGVLYLVLG